MEPVWLGIDLGTQSVRVLAARADGSLAASATEPLRSTRVDGRHEQSPESWWRAVVLCCRGVVRGLGSATEIAGLAVDATSGTILLMDENLRPLTAGLMYDDARALEEAELVNRAGGALWDEMSYRMQPSWALPKLLWLHQHGEISRGARLAHQSDYINARLAGRLLAADSSNSLKTGYDLIRGCWPGDIFEELGLERDLFPEVVAPGQMIGEVGPDAARETGLPLHTPIVSGMTDGCAAQIASGATLPGSWHTVIGTTLVLKGVTEDLLHDVSGVIYSHRSVDGLWLPGGASSTGAGAIAQEFGTAELEDLNREALRSERTALVIYPLVGRGERYPFSAREAHGFSLGEATSRTDRFAATLQGIAFIERLAFDALWHAGADMSGPLSTSGGATRSEALNQIRADVLGRELAIPRIAEGAFGMAMLAAAHSSSMREVTECMVHMERTISPQRRFAAYAEPYSRLIHELRRREWLSEDLAGATLARVHL